MITVVLGEEEEAQHAHWACIAVMNAGHARSQLESSQDKHI